MVHEATRSPRERRHEENLRRILDTAMRMVEDGGLEALSINKLAPAVDYTPGALYRYFASKDELLAKLVERILEDVRGHVDDALAHLPPKASPLARVFAIVRGYRTFARREPERFGLLAMTMAAPKVLLAEPKTAAPVALAATRSMQPLGDALQAAEQAGQLEAGLLAARVVCVFALLQGVLQMHKQARFAPEVLDVERLSVEGTRALLVGWGAKPRMVDAAIREVAAAKAGGVT